MKTRGRLVEHINDTEQIRVNLGREPQALKLPRRQRRRAALKGKVAETKIQKNIKARDEILRDLLAFCVAQTVNSVVVKGDWTAKARFAHAARLHEALKLDMTACFTPAAANYFGKISKTAIFEVLRETNGGDASGMTIRKSELAALAERHVAGTGWLPEPLRAPAPLIAAS